MASIYTDYDFGLTVSGLETLTARQVARCLAFAERCLKNNQTKHLFPLNPEDDHFLRNPEKFSVNFAHTENYRNSTIPYCQRLLNLDHQLEEERRREKGRARHQEGQETGARGEGG